MDITLSLLVLTAIALVLGSIALWKRDGYRKQAVLMLVLALVMGANIAILTMPTKEGQSLAGVAQTPEPQKEEASQ